ncbi:MAG: hypothetical protein K2Q18_05505, partial [Bdellovibrionales bacterium]|nr:hypothetical protein [Bdellovibrionales bacterium]
MIRNPNSKLKFIISFVVALVLHTAIIAFLKYDPKDFAFLTQLSQNTKNLNQPLKIDHIDIVKPEDVEKVRRVGIKDGKKDLQRPDLAFKTPILPQRNPSPPTKSTQNGNGSSESNNLSLNQLAPNLPKPGPMKKAPQLNNQMAKNFLKSSNANDSGSHFYFNYKDQKVIPRSQDQEILKTEAVKNVSAPMNKATERISNFEIRYERPEGVSEDELNSDEKAY